MNELIIENKKRNVNHYTREALENIKRAIYYLDEVPNNNPEISYWYSFKKDLEDIQSKLEHHLNR